MSKAKILLTLLAVLIVGFALGSNWSGSENKTVVTGGVDSQKTITKSADNNPLYYIISLETPKGVIEVKILENAIHFEPYEPNQGGDKSIFKIGLSLDKNKYPKLFQQGGANASFISARVVTQPNGRFFVEVSNNEPDHGSYSASYSLKVDPLTGVIEENTHPRLDSTLSKEDSEYLAKYPHILKLVGNSTLWKLNKNKLIIGGMELESVITIPVTAINEQGLYIFDKNSTYLVDKGYEMNVRVVGKTIEVRSMPEMVGIGNDIVTVKVYEVDQVKNILTRMGESEDWVLRRQLLEVNKLKLEAIFSSGPDCGSCHGQILTINNNGSTILVGSGTDIRVKVVGNNILVKSQSTGGAPSPGTMGVVKVYAVDNQGKALIKVKEYQEEYTLNDYEGR